jgi:hypothetical protein
MESDLSGENALISTHFFYFGSKAISLPPHLLGICHQTQGHKSDANNSLYQPFVDWLGSKKLVAGQIYGWPDFIVDWRNVPGCGCPPRKEDGECDGPC